MGSVSGNSVKASGLELVVGWDLHFHFAFAGFASVLAFSNRAHLLSEVVRGR